MTSIDMTSNQRMGAGLALTAITVVGAGLIASIVNAVIIHVAHSANIVSNAMYANSIIMPVIMIAGGIGIAVATVALRSILNKKIEENDQKKLANFLTAIAAIFAMCAMATGICVTLATFSHHAEIVSLCENIATYTSLGAMMLAALTLFGSSLGALYHVVKSSPVDEKSSHQSLVIATDEGV